MAVPPPTLASAPGMACTVVRIRSTSVYAAGLSGGMVIVACTKDRPSLVTGGATEAMPGAAASASLTDPALAAVEITSTGSPEPAGKYLASSCWAVTEGGVPRNDSAVVSVPNLNPASPAAPAPSRITVTIHTARGRWLMACPTRDHSPRLVGSAEP